MPYKDPQKAKDAARRSYLKRKGDKKVCVVCQIEYPNNEFLKKNDRPSNRERRSSYCHACRKAKLKEYMRRSLYGLDQIRYEEMLDSQKGECAICNKKMQRICVDHRWSDGEVRELLCVQCNALIGQAYEDVAILENAIKYLKKHN